MIDHSTDITLPPRQVELLRLLAEGKMMKEAATAMNISNRTAESHKYDMMKRLGIEGGARPLCDSRQAYLTNVDNIFVETRPLRHRQWPSPDFRTGL